MLKKSYIVAGQVLYIFAIPAMWLLLSRRVRAYVLIEQDARVLLVKNWISRDEWSLPGGGSHKGETAIMAAVREVSEELGVELMQTKMRFLKEGFKKRKIGGKHYALFHYELPAGAVVVRNRTELVDLRWVPLPSLRSTPRISYEVIAALEARDNVTS